MAQKTKKPDAAQCVIYARYSSLAQRDQSIEDDENRTYWAAPFRDCVLLRVKAPFLQ